MAIFSVVGHDDGSEDPDSDLLTATRAEPTTLDGLSREYAHRTAHDDTDALPLTLLELPDLVAVGQWSDQRWTNLGNRVFWVGIILGSLVALWLIWQPVRQNLPAHEEAPTWDGHAAAQPQQALMSAAPTATAEQAAPAWPAEAMAPADHREHDHGHEHGHEAHNEPAATGAWPAEAPAAASPATEDTDALPPADELDAPQPGQEQAPSFDEWSHQQPAAAPLYTARGGDVRNDGGGVHAGPGEAMPTGTIKNVVTP